MFEVNPVQALMKIHASINICINLTGLKKPQNHIAVRFLPCIVHCHPRMPWSILCILQINVNAESIYA